MYSRGLSELVLIVRDVRVAGAFYRDVVGLSPDGEIGDDWAWFWTGAVGAQQRIAVHRGSLLFEEHSPFPEGQRWGRVHFALNVARTDLEDAVAHLHDSGVEVYGPTHFQWMGAMSYYFYDPDGHLVEFWSPDGV